MLVRFIYDSDLIDRDISHLVSFITQVKNAALNIHNVAAECGIRSARHVDLFAQ